MTDVLNTNTEASIQQLKELADAVRPTQRRRLTVGVINNMPDGALDATERQFTALLRGATAHLEVRVQMFSLPGIPRAGAARDRVANYFDVERLSKMHMDAVVVTGAIPGTGALSNEPFWPQFTQLVDWARTNTLSALWSCLSAHAAVLHLDGIARQRLPQKLSGLFDVQADPRHWLTRGLSRNLTIPHSRFNELSESALRDAGYDIVTRCDAAGADMFSKETPSSFVFLQGHPEYDADSLAREYRRDIGKFSEGAIDDFPEMPVNYFPPDVEAKLRAIELHARRNGAQPDALAAVLAGLPMHSRWESTAQTLFRNWIEHVIQLKYGTIAQVRKAV